jgi:hypothetical protein
MIIPQHPTALLPADSALLIDSIHIFE